MQVRRAAAVALAHLSMHVQPEAGEDCDALLPPLLAALAAEPPGGERTRETLVHAVDGVLTHLPEGSIEPYLPPLMAALAALLDTAPPAMHDTLLSCATSAAAAAEDAAFAPYATQLLTRLQPYVEATAKPARSARAAAMDCAGHVAARLEPTAARELLPRFFRAAVGGFELADPLLREYGYALLAMGAQVLGRDFAPWLEGSAQLAFESLDAVRAPRRHLATEPATPCTPIACLITSVDVWHRRQELCRWTARLRARGRTRTILTKTTRCQRWARSSP